MAAFNAARSVAPARRGPPVALIGLWLAGLSALTVLLAAIGYRMQLFPVRTAFSVLRWGAYGGGAAAVISALGVVLTLLRPKGAGRRLLLGTVGIVIGAVVIGIPARRVSASRGLPPIHDVTTDTEDPPVFVAVLPLRENAPNKVAYGGPRIAALQRRGYPDLAPVIVSVAPPQAFERALAAVREMGWELVAADPAAGRIEATDTTFWFGFKDDVVVRVRRSGEASRIDVRSLSRVGGGDAGANATRIRAYLKKLT